MSFRLTVILAFVAAGLSCAFPLAFGNRDFGRVLYVSFALSVGWLAIVIYATAKFRKRGMWTLFGLLPALFWPLLAAFIYYACEVNRDCL